MSKWKMHLCNISALTKHRKILDSVRNPVRPLEFCCRLTMLPLLHWNPNSVINPRASLAGLQNILSTPHLCKMRGGCSVVHQGRPWGLKQKVKSLLDLLKVNRHFLYMHMYSFYFLFFPDIHFSKELKILFWIRNYLWQQISQVN